VGALLTILHMEIGDPGGAIEARLHNKEGKAVSLSVNVENIELQGEQCLLVVGSDITARKKAEKERDTLLARERLARARAEHAWGLTNDLLAREQQARA